MRAWLVGLSLAVSTILAPYAVPAADRLELVAGGNDLFREPFGLDFTADGHLVVVELAGHRVRQIDAQGRVTTRAGTGEKGTADGDPRQAQFNGPHNLVVAANGDIYVADTFNSLIRRIDARTGTVSTIAGTGERGFSGDGGPAKQAVFNQTFHVAFGPGGEDLYVADLGNRRIRQIHLPSGIISTVAGNGAKGVPPDGAVATAAPLVDPRAVALDQAGRMYILERGGHALRVVENGKVRTVAGTGQAGLSGDDGPAIQARLNGPKLIWVDPAGDVLIADAENNCIRKHLAQSGIIVRIAGTGQQGDAGLGGSPVAAQLARPHGVAIGPDGTLYIADSYNHRVLKIAK